MSQAPKYTPNPVPDNPEDLPQYLLQEFQKIQGALEENPIAFIEEKNVEPSRVKQGDIVMLMALTGIQDKGKTYITMMVLYGEHLQVVVVQEILVSFMIQLTKHQL